MALSISLADIMAYRKVSKAYFSLLEVLCHNHTHVIATRDTATFSFLVSAIYGHHLLAYPVPYIFCRLVTGTVGKRCAG